MTNQILEVERKKKRKLADCSLKTPVLVCLICLRVCLQNLNWCMFSAILRARRSVPATSKLSF